MAFNGFSMVLPFCNSLQFAVENGPVEIGDFPSYKMVGLSIVL
jgi:hypothetical protein